MVHLSQNKKVAENSGLFICKYVPGIVMMAMIDIDRILLINLDKAYQAMFSQLVTPFIYIFFAYIYVLHMKLGTTGVALTYFSTNTLIFII